MCKDSNFQNEFIKLFHELAKSGNDGVVWNDIVSCMADSISNAVDRYTGKWEERENDFNKRIKGLDRETVSNMLVLEVRTWKQK